MNRFKHSHLLTATIVLTCSTSYATYNGFYLGANAGVVQTQAAIDSSSDFNSLLLIPDLGDAHLNANLSAASSIPAFDNAPLVAAHIGFGHHFKTNPVYLGAELFISNANTSISSDSVDHLNAFGAFNVKSTNKASINDTEYGLDLKAGFLLTPATLIYGRVGAALNEVHLSTDYNVIDVLDNQAVYATEEEDDVTALRLGVGIERYISRHFSITADYIFTDYGDIDTELTPQSKKTSIPDASVTDTLTSSATADLQSQAVLLGANYYFSGSYKTKHRMNHEHAREHFNTAIIGVRAGGLVHNANFDSSSSVTSLTNSPDDPVTIGHQLTGDTYANGNTGSVFGGYGGLLGHTPFYLAIEIFISEISDAGIKTTETSESLESITTGGDEVFVATHRLDNTIEADLQTEYGLDLRPGILLSDNILLYGRIGAAINQVEIKNNLVYTEIIDGETIASDDVTFENEKDDVTGIRWGLGLEYYIRNHFSVNADYIYTDYGSVATDAEENAEDFEFATSAETDINTQAFMLGVTYHHY